MRCTTVIATLSIGAFGIMTSCDFKGFNSRSKKIPVVASETPSGEPATSSNQKADENVNTSLPDGASNSAEEKEIDVGAFLAELDVALNFEKVPAEARSAIVNAIQQQSHGGTDMASAARLLNAALATSATAGSNEAKVVEAITTSQLIRTLASSVGASTDALIQASLAQKEPNEITRKALMRAEIVLSSDPATPLDTSTRQATKETDLPTMPAFDSDTKAVDTSDVTPR